MERQPGECYQRRNARSRRPFSLNFIGRQQHFDRCSLVGPSEFGYFWCLYADDHGDVPCCHHGFLCGFLSFSLFASSRPPQSTLLARWSRNLVMWYHDILSCSSFIAECGSFYLFQPCPWQLSFSPIRLSCGTSVKWSTCRLHHWCNADLKSLTLPWGSLSPLAFWRLCRGRHVVGLSTAPNSTPCFPFTYMWFANPWIKLLGDRQHLFAQSRRAFQHPDWQVHGWYEYTWYWHASHQSHFKSQKTSDQSQWNRLEILFPAPSLPTSPSPLYYWYAAWFSCYYICPYGSLSESTCRRRGRDLFSVKFRCTSLVSCDVMAEQPLPHLHRIHGSEHLYWPPHSVRQTPRDRAPHVAHQISQHIDSGSPCSMEFGTYLHLLWWLHTTILSFHQIEFPRTGNRRCVFGQGSSLGIWSFQIPENGGNLTKICQPTM